MSEAPKKRWVVTVPIFTHVLPQAFYRFCIAFYRAGRDLPPGHELHLLALERQILHMGMNTAVDEVLNGGFDGLIAFDDDCIQPDWVIPRLVAHADAGRDFVAGMGYMRNYPHTTTVGKYYAEGLTIQSDGTAAGFYWLDKLPTKERGLFKADFCGLPAAIWTRRALELCDKPVFGTTDKDGGAMTHDVFMCRRLTDAGIDVLVDTALECGHIAPAPIIDSVTRDGARAAVSFIDRAKKRAVEIEAAPV